MNKHMVLLLGLCGALPALTLRASSDAAAKGRGNNHNRLQRIVSATPQPQAPGSGSGTPVGQAPAGREPAQLPVSASAPNPAGEPGGSVTPASQAAGAAALRRAAAAAPDAAGAEIATTPTAPSIADGAGVRGGGDGIRSSGDGRAGAPGNDPSLESDSTQLAGRSSGSSASTVTRRVLSEEGVDEHSDGSVASAPDSSNESGAPHVGAPHVGAPHVGAPHVGAPHVGAPHVPRPSFMARVRRFPGSLFSAVLNVVWPKVPLLAPYQQDNNTPAGLMDVLRQLGQERVAAARYVAKRTAFWGACGTVVGSCLAGRGSSESVISGGAAIGALLGGTVGGFMARRSARVSEINRAGRVFVHRAVQGCGRVRNGNEWLDGDDVAAQRGDDDAVPQKPASVRAAELLRSRVLSGTPNGEELGFFGKFKTYGLFGRRYIRNISGAALAGCSDGAAEEDLVEYRPAGGDDAGGVVERVTREEARARRAEDAAAAAAMVAARDHEDADDAH